MRQAGRRIRLLGAAMAMLLTLLTASGVDDLARRLEAASGEMVRADYAGARADLEAAVRLNPASAAAWYQMGLLLGDLADFRGAENAFRRAVQLQPDFAEAHYNLGLTLVAHPQSKLDWPGAISEFQAALKNRPDYAEALNLLGAAFTATGKDEAAIPELERAILLQPDFPEAHFNLGLGLEKLGRLDEAQREYRLAIAARRGNYTEASTALGRLLLHEGKAGEAEAALKQALALNPDLADAHYAMARVLKAMGNEKQASAEFEIARDLAGRKANAVESARLSNQGLEAAAKGDFAGALALLQQAVSLKPDYGVPHYNLGLLLADTGAPRRAVEELLESISLMPGEFRSWYDLARVLHREGDVAGARHALSWAERLHPDDTAIRAEAASLETAGVPAQPKPELLRPEEQPPPDTVAGHIAFAGKLVAQDQLLDVIGELLRALALQPASLETRASLAAAYARVPDTAHAVLEYRKLLWVSPNDGAANLALGKLLLDGGDAEAATEHLRVAVRSSPENADARALLQRALNGTGKP